MQGLVIEPVTQAGSDSFHMVCTKYFSAIFNNKDLSLDLRSTKALPYDKAEAVLAKL